MVQWISIAVIVIALVLADLRLENSRTRRILRRVFYGYDPNWRDRR